MSCPNNECISNKDKVLYREANNFGGVFNKNSGLLIAQHYCINCGENHHKYQSYKIYVRRNNKDKLNFKDLNIKKEN